MEENVKQVLLEYGKRTFHIDLVRHSNGQLYISLQQVIHLEDDAIEQQKIKINPSILDDLIEVLTCFQAELPYECKRVQFRKYFTKERKQELISRYFKGLSIKDLSLQFDCSQHIVEQILSNNGIELVSNDVSEYRSIKWKKRRRKGGANRVS